MPAFTTLTAYVSARRAAAELLAVTFDFSGEAEALAGQTITSVLGVEYAGRQAAAPALATWGPWSASGLKVSGLAGPSPAAAGYSYAVSAMVLFSGGNKRIVPGSLAVAGAGGVALSSYVSAAADAAEDCTYAFEYALFPEALAGQTITAVLGVEYVARQAAAPALAAFGPWSVVGTQVQGEVRADPAAAGYCYLATCLAQFSGGTRRVVPGFLRARRG